jgi:hypothetical protein
MREILFRIWDIKKKKMIYPLSIDLPSITESENYVIMEYAGKIDDNGRYIYEGDIVHCEYRGTGIIAYRNSCFIMEIPDSDRWQYVGKLIKPIIRGNIYENKK